MEGRWKEVSVKPSLLIPPNGMVVFLSAELQETLTLKSVSPAKHTLKRRNLISDFASLFKIVFSRKTVD